VCASAEITLLFCELPHVGMARDMQALLCPNQRDAEGKQNARMDDGNGHCGRDWPHLVGRGDVQIGACAERGNEVGRGYPPRNSSVGRLKKLAAPLLKTIPAMPSFCASSWRERGHRSLARWLILCGGGASSPPAEQAATFFGHRKKGVHFGQIGVA
jgi:hypothetical protein